MNRPWILFAILIFLSAYSFGQAASASGWTSLPPVAKSSIYSVLTRDPAIKMAELTASDGGVDDTLGWNVAISGDTVAVAAPGATIGANAQQGAVYIFVKPASGWANMTQTAKLTASDGQTDSLFGRGVAISGNTVVAGAPGQFTNQQGEAYVFVKPASGWTNMTETARLTPSDGVEGDTFGYSVGISGNTVVVGALGALNLQGAAYVYVKPAGGWVDMTQAGELTASDGAMGDEFADTVAISGNTIVGGSFLDNGSVGAAYVFVKPASGWTDGTQTAKLTPSGNGPYGLGLSVAISGNTVVAGTFDWPGNETFQGAAYVFVEPAGGWANMTQTAILTASDSASQNQLGYSAAISGNIIASGAEGWPDGANEGAIYAYVKPAGGWTNKTETVKLTVSDGAEALGYAVALSGTTGVGGAPFATVNSHQDQGIAYIFTESQ
jgi:uncharacterized protein (DUF2345 family)